MSWGRRPSCTCGTCKKCKKAAYMRRWYRSKTPEQRRAILARRDADRVRQQDRDRHARMKDDPVYVAKRYARAAVNRAIAAGRMQRQPCEVCGDERTHAHHEDYDRVFDVRWLCSLHHGEIHRVKDAA